MMSLSLVSDDNETIIRNNMAIARCNFHKLYSQINENRKQINIIHQKMNQIKMKSQCIPYDEIETLASLQTEINHIRDENKYLIITLTDVCQDFTKFYYILEEK